MLRRLPLIPTLIVLLAVSAMVRLGLWQLDRMHQKEVLLARYVAAGKASEVSFEGWAEPGDTRGDEAWTYRRVWTDCVKVLGLSARAGRNAQGETGWAHVAECRLQQGAQLSVVLGWSNSPAEAGWAGGLVHGTIGPARSLVADPPLAGLQANARPDPNDIPNNHLSYALQWFAFAAAALAIYLLALRKRLAV